MEDPKKRLSRSEDVRSMSRRDLERQIKNVASSLAGRRGAGFAGEEDPVPCWIEPLQLIRIVAPFVSMN